MLAFQCLFSGGSIPEILSNTEYITGTRLSAEVEEESPACITSCVVECRQHVTEKLRAKVTGTGK